MPVRWDADKKATLFVTIMNTHPFSVDAQRVVDAWPGDGDEKPTARAIKEILGKIKKNVATKSGGASANTTPVKVTKAKPKATPRSAKKRKKVDDSSDSSDSDSPDQIYTLKQLKELRGGSPTPKQNANKNVAAACFLPNSSEDQSVTATGSVNGHMGYPTPADTASPAETTAFRSTPRRAASAKIANYIKEEHNESGKSEDEDEDGGGANDEGTSEADSDVSAWETNYVEEV